MKLFIKIILICITFSFKSIANADEIKELIDKTSDKLSSFITNNLVGGGLTEFSIDIPEDDVEIQFLNFKELNKEELENSFSQFSINTQETNDDTRYIINYGYGKRYMDKDKSVITGFNAFLDYDFEGHARTSVGIEAKGSMLDLSANYYLGLSEIEKINGVNERVLDGYEINLTSQLPYMPWAKINYQNYEFAKDTASEDTGGNIVSLEMSLTPNVQFEASRNFVSVSGVDDEDTYRLMYYNPPKNKTSMQDGLFSSDIFEKENMENKMIEKVRRRNKLTIEIQGAVILTKQ